ncbi:MAG: hypothetical protein AAGG09_02140 [Pseudomonadota bacterium]
MDDLETMRASGLLREDASLEDTQEYLKLTNALSGFLQSSEGISGNVALHQSRLIAMAPKMALTRVLKGCSRGVGTSPLDFGNHPTDGRLILICDHSPQHWYELNGTVLK